MMVLVTQGRDFQRIGTGMEEVRSLSKELDGGSKVIKGLEDAQQSEWAERKTWASCQYSLYPFISLLSDVISSSDLVPDHFLSIVPTN